MAFMKTQDVPGIMTPDGGLGSAQGGASLSDNGASAPLDDRVDEKVPLSSHSRFAQRLRRRYAGELALLAPGTPTREAMVAAYDLLRKQGHDTGTALRILRQLVMERLISLDCDEQAPLGLVTRAVTELAEFALDIACVQAQRELDAQFGAPTTPDGTRAELWIVGMGKLGARELNVSSDIDLIYLYDQDGETAGSKAGGPASPTMSTSTRPSRSSTA